ncbi:NAD(P)-binding domain protein [Apiospora arundinis]|uniref:3beta-hydroxysteroid 3-dehydrogenase n=1 Tax=Apiospora arundinis TaxID=335852 RepID=A0ABR2JNQ9_9PEZI
MSNQKGSILVTGANGGLGSAIVSRIVSVPDLETYHGIFTVRETESATALDAALGASSSEPGVFQSHEKISLDLSQLGSVREVAAAINARVEAGAVPPISAIILNAGFTEYDTQTWNKDGLDLTFVVNYLAHWLLVLLLLRSMDRERGRIVWISSWSHNPEHPQNIMNGSFKDDSCKTMITDALDPLAKGLWSPTASEKPLWTAAYRRYGASKMCGVAMIHELQRRLDQDPVLSKISVLAIDPGGMNTGIVRHSPWLLRFLVFQVLAGVLGRLLVRLYPNGSWRTPQKSARDVLAAALDCGPLPLTEQPKGVYFNGSELGDYNPEAKDPEKGRVIWEGSLRFTQLQGTETILRNWQ